MVSPGPRRSSKAPTSSKPVDSAARARHSLESSNGDTNRPDESHAPDTYASPAAEVRPDPSLRAPQGLEAWVLSVEGEEVALLAWPEASARQRSSMPLTRLTAAESRVASLAADGRPNREIARIRGCATRTIANQLAKIFRKLGIRSRLELCALLAQIDTRAPNTPVL
jgi:DNA-binding CsgD family transcriptional regulator